MYNQPPGAPHYNAPGQQPPRPQYGAPPPQGQPYGAPPPHGGGYGGPPQGGGYGAPPPQQGGYGAPPRGYGAPPPQQQPGGYGAPQGGYGPPQGGYGPPQGGYPGQAQAPYHQAPGQMPGGPGPQCPPGVNPEVFNWFVSVDRDRSGHITANELQQALTNQNWTHFNAETCRLMIGMFDKNQSGTIDLQEFQSLWGYIQQWRGVFERYDRDRSGFIEVGELTQAWNEMGYRLSPNFVNVAVRRFDRTGRGGLTLDFFIQACVMLQSMTNGFRAKDSRQCGEIKINYEDFLTMVLLNKV